MKRLKFIIILLFLCCGLGAWADNNITLSSVEGAAGTEVTVSVSMTNTDAVSALQLSIPLDDNLTFVQNSQKAGSRLSGHSLSAGVKDGVLNLMVYSATMVAISGNEGEVCSFKLQLGNNPGTISFTPSKSALTGTNGNSLAVSVTAGSVLIRGAKVKIGNNTLDFGRVAINGSSQKSVRVDNVGNETLAISDISFSSSEFSTTTTLPLTINAGSSKSVYVYCKPTKSDILDEEMTLTSNSISGNSIIRLTATPYGVNELRLESVSGMTGEEVTVPVTMNNIDAITGLQMEIKIPSELEYVDGSFALSSRRQDHVVTASEVEGILSVVAYSPTDQAFSGNDGEVGSFRVKIVGSKNASLSFTKAMLSSTIDDKTTNVLSGSYGCTVGIKSPSLSASNNLNLGRISINEKDKQMTYYIGNYGSAPLIISNITFGNGLFRVKEQLPLTIEASSSKNITVVCDSKEDGDISTKMEIYTNDPQKRLFSVNITGEIYAPNELSCAVEANRIGLNLDVFLNNYSNIYGIQFDINTTKIFTASSDKVMLTERGNNLSVSVNSVNEGKIRVIAYPKIGQYIGSGESKVMTIKLVSKEVLPVGDYSLTLSNIMLGSKAMQNIYSGTEPTVNFGVSGVVPGDANKDGKVGIGDIIAIKNIMVGKDNGYDLEAADANQDNKVNDEDIAAIINYMGGK